MPGFGLSLFTAILPVILMLISTIVQLITGHEEAKNLFEQIVYFIGTAGTAMLISVIFAIFNGLEPWQKDGRHYEVSYKCHLSNWYDDLNHWWWWHIQASIN